MSGSTQILEELFVRISLKQDGNVVDALTKINKGFEQLALAAVAAAAAVTAAAQKMSADLESLYFAANRMGSTASGIQAFSYAMSQLGVAGGAAAGTLEAVGRFIRSTPGANSYFRSLGVSLTDANGRIRDTAALVLDLGDSLSKMPFYRAQAYANVLGIDYTALLALTRGLREYNDQYRLLLRAAGVDTDRAAEAAHKFQVQLRLLWATVGVVFQRFFQSLGGNVTGQLTRFNKFVLDNFHSINDAVDRTARFFTLMLQVVENSGAVVYRIFTEITGLVGSVWHSLTDSEKGWVKWGAVVLGVLVALEASPLFVVAAAFAALADDYEVWRKGGTSAINWGPIVEGLERLKKPAQELGSAFRALLDAFEQVSGPNTPGFDKSRLFSANALFEDAARIVKAYTDALLLLKTTLEWFTKHPELPEPNPDVLKRQGKRVSPVYPYNVIPDPSSPQQNSGPGWLQRHLPGLFGESSSGSHVWDAAKTAIEKYLLDRDQDNAVGKPLYQLQKYLGTGAQEMMRSIADHVNSSSWFKGDAAGESGGGGFQTINYSTSDDSTPSSGIAPSTGSAPLGVRQNNPGNLRRWQGAGSANGFAVFRSAMDGLIAMRQNLQAYGRRGWDTLSKIIEHWAPRGDHNDTSAYVARVARSLGVDPNARLNLNDPSALARLMDAMIKVEQGYNPYSQRDVGAAAGLGGLPLGVGGGTPGFGSLPPGPTGDAPRGTGVVHVNAHTTIHVNGGGTALETANAVAREQSRVNADLVRNFRPTLI